MATYEFKLPDIGEGVVEGEIVKWLVKEGESVAEDQALVEGMTDKATVTIPSPKRGRVLQTHGKEGEIAKVHQPLVTLELDAVGSGVPAVAARSPQPGAASTAPSRLGGNGGVQGAKVLATPVTRRMAREHGLEIDQIPGSGPRGRGTKASVIAAIGQPTS